MKIFGKCENCKNENGFLNSAKTRVEFAMQYGEKKTLTCKNCGMKKDFHVDELYKKESKIAQIIAGLVFLIGTPLVFFLVSPVFMGTANHYFIYIVGGLLLVPVIVFGMIKKQDQMRVQSFNRSKLKGRMSNIG